ncbi:putative transcriptional regulatory protein C15D4.02 [Colletotrichum tanaceti]|uniref:Putative transcriptional regulatory protein C15D4.02 n=1 Tax=Colletotrichum tanaceti TaxID=1306861 RepID=A0A4U6X9B1_9PEZI|nr:putative transcriptional regulatory protein C15D4.02 [Colletotrichum tanaceti]TKW51619.1 putative transcriptional regulatory protein C15D4.02 [Colletotrichum tanaceti]
MARKGSKKARTGCITCKIRKVKCDETKPSCNRCIATGRHCDGYQPPGGPSARNRLELRHYYHQPHHQAFPGAVDHGEGRALQYFCQEAGPYLSGAVNPEFWPRLVMQFAVFDPATRHSVIAISSLAERMRYWDDRAEDLRLRDEIFALRHYNVAIRHLTTGATTTTTTVVEAELRRPAVLLVCLLFTAIETLQSKQTAAIKHCKHGVELLRDTATVTAYPWIRDHLLPFFRRTTIIAFVHGDDPDDFPSLAGLEHPIPAAFSVYSDAQVMIDDVLSRTLQLVRRADAYRVRRQHHHPGEQSGSPVPPELLLAEQARLNHSLDVWKALFDDYESRASRSLLDAPGRGQGAGTGHNNNNNNNNNNNMSKASRFVLLCRHESCRVWLNTALGGGDDYDYDQHLAAYEAMLDDVGITDPRVQAVFTGDAYFIIDEGYLPSISVVATKCSHLESRLRSLGMAPLPGLPRENLCLLAQAGGCDPAVKQTFGHPTTP